jgi:glycerophosphoryl diester phosphodiesterase
MDRTLVVAHRTCPRDARENSLDGISTAARLGADVVEVDARRSRNGTVVLLHDPWLGRIQHVPWPLRWTGARLLRRVGIPTLAAALDVARAVGVHLAIDTKDAGAAQAVVDVVRTASAQPRVLLWSHDMPAVRLFAAALPDVEAGLFRNTFDDEASEQLVRDAIAIGARAVSVHQDVATASFIASARERGVGVYCGYEDLRMQTSRLPEAVSAGLRGVVTDWPAEARDLLARLA